MVRIDIVKEWLRHAEMDLSSAESLVQNMYPAPCEIICFHCQQSAEKDLKALMVLHDLEPPKTHDLPELLKECQLLHPELSIIHDKCHFLNRYSVTPRYPNEIQMTGGDMKFSLQYAKNIKESVAKIINSAAIETDDKNGEVQTAENC
jgi:HEPN domain-containing protein